MGNCYLCGEFLNKGNSSKEHIIPNAIGGKLKSSDLLCKNCNNLTGDKIDYHLSEALSLISKCINIKRERKSGLAIPFTLEKGSNVLLKDGLEMERVPNVVKGKNKFTIRASSKKEALKMLNTLKKRNPSIDADKAKENLSVKTNFVSENIDFEIKFDEACYRALGKIITNFYIYMGYDKFEILELIDFIKGVKKENPLNWYTAAGPFVFDEREVCNTVSIIGDPNFKKLVGIVEIYSTFKLYVIINNNYSGESFCDIYSCNVENGIQNNICVKESEKKRFLFNISNETYNGNKFELQKNLNRLSQYCFKKTQKRVVEKIISKSSERLKKQYSFEQNTYITDEMKSFLIKDSTENVVTYLYKTGQLPIGR